MLLRPLAFIVANYLSQLIKPEPPDKSDGFVRRANLSYTLLNSVPTIDSKDSLQ
jgi:hypothetical protein